MDLTRLGFREGYDMNNRFKIQENIELEGVGYFVSTVDLGLDHQYGDGPPLYYETMIFEQGDWTDLYLNRYSTENEARAGHHKLMQQLRMGNYEIKNNSFEIKQEEDTNE